jgi:hypothetical protein
MTTQGEQKYCIHGTNRDYNGNKNFGARKINHDYTRGTKVLRPQNKLRLQREQIFCTCRTNHDYTRGTKVLHPRNKLRLQREQKISTRRTNHDYTRGTMYCVRGTNRDYNGNKN